MTDQDKSEEGFLGRWSRKKIERETPEAPAEPAAAAVPAEPPAAPPKPEFDLASLPSLDSIVAGTDIRAFLDPAVPGELTRAALRRAWSADPAIRDFVGLAENAWDFTDPTAMPGFGELPVGTDIKRLLAQVFGQTDEPEDKETEQLASEEPAPPPPAAAAEPPNTHDDAAPPDSAEPQATPSAGEAVAPRDGHTALHNSNADADSQAPETHRKHGGALPQ
jgi:hypothetical protein